MLSKNSTSTGLRLKKMSRDTDVSFLNLTSYNKNYLWQWPGIKYKQQCTRLSTMFFLTTPLSSEKYARNCSSTYSQQARIQSSLFKDEPKPEAKITVQIVFLKTFFFYYLSTHQVYRQRSILISLLVPRCIMFFSLLLLFGEFLEILKKYLLLIHKSTDIVYETYRN